MKQKLIDLYKHIIDSDKTIITKYNYNHNSYSLLEELQNNKFGIKDTNIYSKAKILSSDDIDEFYLVKTGKYDSWDNFNNGIERNFNQKDIDSIKNNKVLEATKKKETPFNGTKGVSISFSGKIPTLMVYMVSDIKSKTIYSRHKIGKSLFKKDIKMIKKDILLKYYISLGSKVSNISEHEYVSMIKHAENNHDLSTNNIINIINGRI